MIKLTWHPAILLLVFLVTGCTGSHPLAPTPLPALKTGTLHGAVYLDQASGLPKVARILGEGLRPIAGAVIAVRGYPSVLALSDSSGSFTMDSVPCGEQTFYVSCPAHTRTSFTQAIREGVNVANPYYSGQPAQSTWTVLVYMCADNNLERAAIADVNEMEAAAVPEVNDPNPAATVLVQLDRSPLFDTTNGDWVGARRLRIVHDDDRGKITSPFLDVPPLGDTDTGDPETLRKFLNWGQQMAPAEHYLVVLWNHGNGWTPDYDASIAPTDRAICVDDSSGFDAIRDVDLPYALASPDPIDVLAMDACSMSMVEVAYQIRRQADYLVASEGETPWQGMHYTHLLNKLISESATITPADLATFMVEDNYQTWINSLNQNIAASAIDLSKMDQVAASLDALAKKLSASRIYDEDSLHRIWSASIPFGPRDDKTYNRDLYDYAQRLAGAAWSRAVRQSALDLERDLQSAVLASRSDLPQAHGLSIYFPPAGVFKAYAYSHAYGELALARDTAWDEWLTQNP